MPMRGARKDKETPVRAILGRAFRFDCSMLPCIRVEPKWAAPLPPPTFASWRAVDNQGKPVNLTKAEQQAVQNSITGPGPVQQQPPNDFVVLPCIKPCECTNEQRLPWVQGPAALGVDVTMTVHFPNSAADTVTVTVSWQAARYRLVIGMCAHLA